jgi:hypothetical protein
MEFEIIVLKDANLIKYFDFDYQFFGFVFAEMEGQKG